MSFSFSVTAASPDEAKRAVAVKLAEVVAGQPAHGHDLAAIINATNAYVDLVEHGAGETIAVSLSGSVGWTGSGEEHRFNGAGVSISVRSYTAS